MESNGTWTLCSPHISVVFKAAKRAIYQNIPKFSKLHALRKRFEGEEVVTGMEAEQIIESLANYVWFVRVANAVCISHLLLIDRRAPVDLGRHKCTFLVTFNLKKLIIFVNSIKRIRAGTFLGLTSETTISNNLTAKVSVKCIKWFAMCAFLKLTDLISLISICRNVPHHKLDWDTVDTFFYDLFLNSMLY